MADFEGLIRQALARQNADDPAIRERIYQSSRNALARMIAAGKAQSPETINIQREALENSIRRIEAGYAAWDQPQPQVPPDPPQLQPASQNPAASPQPPAAEPEYNRVDDVPVGPDEDAAAGQISRRGTEHIRQGQAGEPRREAYAGTQRPAGMADVRSVPVPEGMDRAYRDYPGDGGVREFSVDPDEVSAHARPQRSSRRGFTVAAFVVLLLVVGGLVYFLFEIVSGGDAPDNRTASQPAGQQEDPQGNSQVEADYITVLSPVDTGSLVLAGRGRADIVNQANIDYVRLVSLRPDSNLDETANPILLEIEPGVLQQIRGRRVTVEIQAKSGDSGPANFAVGCEVNGEDICGRRRFRIGLQPEATIFPMSVSSSIPADAKAYLTINTDVTNTALQSGEGSAVDVLYARLRLPQEQ